MQYKMHLVECKMYNVTTIEFAIDFKYIENYSWKVSCRNFEYNGLKTTLKFKNR